MPGRDFCAKGGGLGLFKVLQCSRNEGPENGYRFRVFDEMVIHLDF